jgi:hypothetical protein
MKRALLAGGLALGLLVSPATAQAPSVETRLAEVETALLDLQQQVEEVQEQAALFDACWKGAIPVSVHWRKRGYYVLTRKDRRPAVYAAILKRSCLGAVPGTNWRARRSSR